MEFPKNEGVRPASKEMKTFFKRLKNWTMDSKEISPPATKLIFNSLSQYFPFMNRAKKAVKIKINSQFNKPPVLIGQPKILIVIFSENIVDMTKFIANPKSARNGRKDRLFAVGKEIEISFFMKNLKTAKKTKAVKISLNKITRLQSDGWKSGGKRTMGRNKMKAIAQKNTLSFFCPRMFWLLFSM